MRTGLYWFPDGDSEKLHNRTNVFPKKTASSVQPYTVSELHKLAKIILADQTQSEICSRMEGSGICRSRRASDPVGTGDSNRIICLVG